MAADPYAAPRSHVADVPSVSDEGQFVPEGRTVPVGNGWGWIRDGWSLFTKAPGPWVLIVIVFLAITIVLSLIPVLGSLAVTVLGPVFSGGVMLGCRDLDRGEALTVGHLFAGFRDKGGPLALIGVFGLVGLILAVLVSVLVAGTGFGTASMFLGAPPDENMAVAATGIILSVLIMLALLLPVYMAMWFAPALVALRDLTAGEALKRSFGGALKNILPFLVYGLVLVPLAIVASLPLALGWLVLAPVLMASLYTGYRDIYFAR